MPAEQSANQQQEAPVNTPDTEASEQLERRYKTIAVRVEDHLHSQLQFLAQLSGSSISEEIRSAIQRRIDAAHDDPELIARAEAARQQIEREAAARTAAIAGFMGKPATAAASETADADGAATPRSRRSSSKANG